MAYTNHHNNPVFRAKIDEIRIKSGQEPFSDSEWEKEAKLREETIERAHRKIAISLELTGGKHLPDGAGGTVDNDGRWYKDEDGKWTT